MDAAGAVKNGIGQPVLRKEDLRLLVGQGHYGTDITLPHQAHAVMVRSPHAHARLRAIDSTPRAPPPAWSRC